jgi:hypothetical protein
MTLSFIIDKTEDSFRGIFRKEIEGIMLDEGELGRKFILEFMKYERNLKKNIYI